jgi:N-acyl-D-aspartate/D-glutamate deacylase
VAIQGGRIVGVGRDLGFDFDEVDLSGLVLSPGFVDPHTHYDAQLFWDPDITPSSWHGVTTVVTGNCGFTLAPTRPDHRNIIVRTLENVEGMSVAALEAGLPWSFETFPEYLRAVDSLDKRLNVACLIGHTALRWFVLGDEATEREASRAEVARMCELVTEAMECGAVGFSTSQHNHIGAFGKPVPSRAASHEELQRIAETLGQTGAGAIEIALGASFGVADAVSVAKASGRPVTWSGTALVPTAGEGGADAAAAAVDASCSSGASVVPQFPCRPIVNQVTLRDPFPLRHASDGFLEVLRADPEERLALYGDEDWRRRAKETLQPLWVQRLADATVEETNAHTDIRNGPTLGQLAAKQGTTPFDLLIDLSLADGLATRFKVAVANTDEAVIAQLLADRRCIVGLSDAGAHVSQLCDANYATHLLSYWVRERQALPLELAVWRLTGQPAALYGLADRGRIEVGAAADLVAFDPARVGPGEAERVWDFPGGTDRLVARSTGIEYVWVNGTPIRSGGADLPGVAPGRWLASEVRFRSK